MPQSKIETLEVLRIAILGATVSIAGRVSPSFDIVLRMVDILGPGEHFSCVAAMAAKGDLLELRYDGGKVVGVTLSLVEAGQTIGEIAGGPPPRPLPLPLPAADHQKTTPTANEWVQASILASPAIARLTKKTDPEVLDQAALAGLACSLSMSSPMVASLVGSMLRAQVKAVSLWDAQRWNELLSSFPDAIEPAIRDKAALALACPPA